MSQMQSASPPIANEVLMANDFDICLYPIMINGILKITISSESGRKVISFTIRDIPVTPPSRKRLGSRKPLRPKPAEKMPAIIKMPERKLFRLMILDIPEILWYEYN